MQYADHYRVRNSKTRQDEEAHGAVPNNAGGFSFALDEWAKLDRFLILGTEGGTYYVSERKLTRDQAKNVQTCIELDGERVVRRIIEISATGRAPKNTPALFALAMCAGLGDEVTRKMALDNLSKVARIGTHLFLFAEYVEAFRGWGRGLKTAVGKWYNDQEIEKLLYQAIKYQQREGWSHRDLLRLCHAKSTSDEHQALYNWICSNGKQERQKAALECFPKLRAIAGLKSGIAIQDAYTLITQHRLPREVIPTDMLNNPRVWEALLIDMPITALIRNLGKMTNIGLVTDFSDAENMVLEKLTDKTLLKKGRVHPLTILTALMTYQSGSGVRGGLSWNPCARIIEALEQAFYDCFTNVVPTNKRILVAVDISGSMHCSTLAGTPMTPGDAAAALSMITKATESRCLIKAFSHRFIDLSISKKMSLKEVIQEMNSHGFGRTDCALPMTYATENRLPIDAFIVLTDCETWCGNIYPSEALKKYRDASGIDAKLIVCGMVANDFSIADPKDSGMLDVVGFDTSTPDIMAHFIRGQI